jgi:hypothetical protein
MTTLKSGWTWLTLGLVVNLAQWFMVSRIETSPQRMNCLSPPAVLYCEFSQQPAMAWVYALMWSFAPLVACTGIAVWRFTRA